MFEFIRDWFYVTLIAVFALLIASLVIGSIILIVSEIGWWSLLALIPISIGFIGAIAMSDFYD